MNELMIVDDEYLPPELLLDKDIPMNAEFFRKQRHLERQITAQTANMSPKRVQLVRAVHTGVLIKQAAEKADYTPSGATKALKREDSMRLLGLMRLLTSLNEGPNTQHRMNMLYQIAMDNQHSDPKTSISAIEVMNKMTQVYDPKNNSNNVINIQINGDVLPRTTLDRQPVTIDG